MSRTKTISPRLGEVWRYVAYGYTNPEIAKKLALKESTVKQYVQDLLYHLKASNRVQLALEYHDIPWRGMAHPDLG